MGNKRFSNMDHLHEHGVTYKEGPNTDKLVYISFKTQETMPAEQIGDELVLKKLDLHHDPVPTIRQIPKGANAYICSVWSFAGKEAHRPTEFTYTFFKKLPVESPQ